MAPTVYLWFKCEIFARLEAKQWRVVMTVTGGFTGCVLLIGQVTKSICD